MLFADFLQWWYGPGWALRLKMLIDHVKNLEEYFSILTIFKTLFSPWRQNISTPPPDVAMGEQFRALLDNVISRFVGFMVRSVVLFAAFIIILVVFLLNLLYVIIWPIIPLSPAVVFLIGVMSS